MNRKNIEKDYTEKLAEQVFSPGKFTETDSTIEFDCIAITACTISRNYGFLEITAEELAKAYQSFIGNGIFLDHYESVSGMIGGIKSAELVNDKIRLRLQVVKTDATSNLVALIKLTPSPIRYVSSTFSRDAIVINQETSLFKASNIVFKGISLVFEPADKDAQTKLSKNQEDDMPDPKVPVQPNAAPSADPEKLSADLATIKADNEALSLQVEDLKSDAALGKQYREKLSANVSKYVGIVEGDKSPILSLVATASVEVLEKMSDEYEPKAREKMSRSAQPPKKEAGGELTTSSLEQMSKQELIALQKDERLAAIDASTNPEFFPTYYQRLFLTTGAQHFVTDMYGQDIEIPANSGKKASWKKITIPAVEDVDLSNQPTPDPIGIGSDDVEATLTERGKVWSLDEMSELTSFWPLAAKTAEVAGIHAQRTLEFLNLKGLLTSTNVTYAKEVANRDALDGTKLLDKDFLLAKWALLDDAGVMPVEDGNYICFINPTKFLNIFSSDDLIRLAASDPSILKNGYAKVFGGIKFITSNNSALKTTNAGGKTVYRSLIFGANAYGKVALNGRKGAKLTITNTDRMGRVKNIGWLGYHALAILDEDAVMVVESN